MQSRRLGRTGLKAPVIGVGGWVFKDASRKDQHIAVVQKALQDQPVLIDTAPGYDASEESIGLALAQADRNKVILSTKYYPYGAGDKLNLDPAALEASVATSLLRLKTDHLDLLHLHWVHSAQDAKKILGSPLATALRKLQASGQVRSLAISEASELDGKHETLEWVLPHKFFDSIMVCYNLLFQTADRGVMDLARQTDTGVLVMMPLNQPSDGSGLVNKQTAFENIKRLRAEKELPDEAPYLEESVTDFLTQGTSLNFSQACLRWVLDRPEVSSVLVGTTNVAHFDEAVKASEAPPLSEATHTKSKELFGKIVKQIK